MSDLRIEEAGAVDAAAVRDVIHAAFGARQRVEPPSTALEETTESVAEALKRDGGLLCRVDAQPAGAMLFGVATSALVLRRVSVVPHFQSRGLRQPWSVSPRGWRRRGGSTTYGSRRAQSCRPR
ncbi:MAG: hypothetical protein WKF76_08795 [Nocardioidaceae bacterium]